MNIIEVDLLRSICWLIHKNDPVTYKLKSRPELSLINPLLVPLIAKGGYTSQSYMLNVIVRNGVLVHTRKLLLLSSEGFERKRNGIVEEGDAILGLVDYIRDFAASLRYTSKQVDINGEIIQLEQHSIEQQLLDETAISFPTASSNDVYYKEYFINTAVTWKALEQADCMLADKSIPVFSTLFLDAIHAFNGKDYRRVILYSAMTLEALASTKLDEAYTSFLNSDNPPARLHIVSFPQRGGVISKKDPIYTALSEADKFSRLLHELPLYLLDRSLLLENEMLYQKTMKMYQTRNKIVHTGNIPKEGGSKYFKTNEDDAREILLCVKDVLLWFGVTEEYILPLSGFIPVKSVEGRDFSG